MKWKILLPIAAEVVIASGLVIARAHSADRNTGVFGRGSVLSKVAYQLQFIILWMTLLRRSEQA